MSETSCLPSFVAGLSRAARRQAQAPIEDLHPRTRSVLLDTTTCGGCLWRECAGCLWRECAGLEGAGTFRVRL